MRYKLNSSGRGLVFFGGPSLAFKVSANATADFGGGSVSDDISDEIESFDFGLVFGAGWEAGRLSIDGRYTWGLSRINVDEADPQRPCTASSRFWRAFAFNPSAGARGLSARPVRVRSCISTFREC